MAKQLKHENILESWSHLIEGAEERGEEIFREVVKEIERFEPENVELKRETVFPQESFLSPSSILPTFFKGERREYLTVLNKHLKHYKIYVGTRKYGKQLLVSWYLVKEGGLSGKLMEQLEKFKFMPYVMNIFDHEELTAYATTVHHAILESVGDMMRKLNQDPSKMDRKSKGFLSIS